MEPSDPLKSWLSEHGLLYDVSKSITKAREILEVARARFEAIVPYYIDTLHMLSTYWAPYMFAMAGSPIGVTHQLVLLVDPGWVAYIDDPDMMAGVLWHEVEHPNRGMDRLAALENPELANLAGDLAINWRIRKVGVKLPEWVVYPEVYNLPEGLTLEEYYCALQKQQQEKEGIGEKQQGASGEETGQEGPEQDSEGGQGGKDSPSKMTESWEPTGASFGKGKCGSAAGNSLGDIEEEANKEKGCTPIERELAREKTRAAVRHYIAQHGRGTIPGEMVDKMDAEEAPAVVPWKQVLRSIISHTTGKLRAGYEELSWSRPSLHSLVRGQPRPGPCAREPEILIVRDTSGSMGHEELESANNESMGILRQLGVESVWFMDVDAEAYDPVRVRLRDIPKLELKGRGGTSFIPAFEAAEKIRPRPELLIYMTDGDGAAPERPPRGMAVVWCIVPTRYGRKPAKWGHLVVVSDDQDLREPYQ